MSIPFSFEPLDREAELVSRIENLLGNIGDPGACRGCSAPIYWVTHKNGRKTPYTPQGLNHFADCPNAKDFKKKVSE